MRGGAYRGPSTCCFVSYLRDTLPRPVAGCGGGYGYLNYQCITNAKEEFYEKIGSILSDANGQYRLGCGAE